MSSEIQERTRDERMAAAEQQRREALERRYAAILPNDDPADDAELREIQHELGIGDDERKADAAALAEYAEHARQRPSTEQRLAIVRDGETRLSEGWDAMAALLVEMVQQLRRERPSALLDPDIFRALDQPLILAAGRQGSAHIERARQRDELRQAINHAERAPRNALAADDQHAAAMEHLQQQRPRAFGIAR